MTRAPAFGGNPRTSVGLVPLWRREAAGAILRNRAGMSVCLGKDRNTPLAFYDFPAEHWKHLRTTNPIEITFATVRHRTIRSKGCLSNRTALAMVFKLLEAVQKSWRRLDGHNQLPKPGVAGRALPLMPRDFRYLRGYSDGTKRPG